MQNLKTLRNIVKVLASVIDDGIARAEKKVLPLSRCHGINSLPSEVMVKIMDLVVDVLADTPEEFKEMLWTFWEVPPFKTYLTEAKGLLEIPKRHDRARRASFRRQRGQGC